MLLKNSADMLTYFTFTTPRLCLKPVDLSALPLLAKLYGCSKTMRYIAPPFTYLKTKMMLEKMLYKQQQQQCDSLILSMKDKISLIDYGISGIPRLDFIAKQAEVGVMLLPNGQGQGIAVEAMQAIVTKLVSLGIHTIYMQINPKNKAAIIGANKVGFIVQASSGRYMYSQAS